MDAAQASNLPLVAIEPFGVNVKVPAEVAKRAAEVVGWNERLIVDAVRRASAARRHAAVGHDRVQALSCRTARRAMKPPPIVIAHRGASGYLPEHTLAAQGAGLRPRRRFPRARRRRNARRRQLVVLHDLYLDDVTDVARRFPGRQRSDGRHYVIDFDLAELETLTHIRAARARHRRAEVPGALSRATRGCSASRRSQKSCAWCRA